MAISLNQLKCMILFVTLLMQCWRVELGEPALISLFSADDKEMIAAKAGRWWEKNPQRARANNSAALVRHRIRKKNSLKNCGNVFDYLNRVSPEFILQMIKIGELIHVVKLRCVLSNFCNLCEVKCFGC